MTLSQVFGRAVRAAYTELSSEEALEVYAQWGAVIRSNAVTATIFTAAFLVDSIPKAVGAAQVLADVGIGLYNWSVDQFNKSETVAQLSEQLLLPAEKVRIIEDHTDFEQDDLFWFEPSDYEQFTAQPEPVISTPGEQEEPQQPVKLGIRELRLQVKALGVKGFSRMTKDQCIEVLISKGVIS